MLTITRIGRLVAVLLALCAASIPVVAAPPSGGSSNKVSVTAANPSDAFQGEELDVIVSGSGFDAGSTVSYLVTGTTDASQVDVLSVQYISSSELRTRIRPKDNALPTEYDIQVQSSSGRKGKGTTLFRVKVVEMACTGDERKEPEIAYLTALDTSGEIHTRDIYLSSGSGCDQYLLLDSAVQLIPRSGSDPKAGEGEYLANVLGLRFDVDGDDGVLIWTDRTIQPTPLLALRFQLDSGSNPIADPWGPEVVYSAPDDYKVYYADVRLSDSGEIEVITTEYAPDQSEWRLVYVNVDQGLRMPIAVGECPFQDSAGICFGLSTALPWWNGDGTEVFLNPNTWPDTENEYSAVASIPRVAGEWRPARIRMKNTAAINIIGIRADGLLAYEWLHYVSRKKGRTSYLETYWRTATVDPETCILIECAVTDGLEMAADGGTYPRGWTRAGGMLFIESGSGSQLDIREYSNPFTGEVGRLRIENVDRYERDTSY